MSDPDPSRPSAIDSELTRPPSDHDARGRRIGPYRFVRKLGEGGMGEVWLADQVSPLQRQVAVKVIKLGMDSAQILARFDAERQALALMDHPAIAKVFDGGAAPDGRPYFVMEFVRGEPITDYCDRMACTIRQRLELFAKLCDGVQHAHQKGIIHRDLKPSNVLVAVSDDEPTPRIIDFGIAKAIIRPLTATPFHTEAGGFVGTPEYMSPEQAEAGGPDVDTRSDVYSLGAILYELLVGTLPHDRDALRAGGYDDARRVLAETARKPSSRAASDATAVAAKRQLSPARLVAAVRGDLDWITLKALERDRTRRYPTANALALDVRRHLANEPVSAGPPGSGYRMRKFLRRHGVATASATAAVLALAIFAGVLALQARRLASERDRANQQAAMATQVTQFLTSLFNISDPGEARGNSLTAREVLDNGALQLETGLRDQPLVRARMATVIGRVYTNLGLYAAARPLLEAAVEVARSAAGEQHPETIDAMDALATLVWYQQNYARAVELYQKVYDARRSTLGDNDRATLRAKFDLSSAYQGAMRLDEAEVILRETLDRQRATLGADDRDTLESLNNVQALYYRSKRYAEALPIAIEVLNRQTRVLGASHPLVLLAAHNLGAIYLELKEHGPAERFLRQSLEGRRTVLGPHHDRTLTTWDHYARLLEERGHTADAQQAYEDIVLEIGDDEQTPYPTIAQRALERLLALADPKRDATKILEWKRRLAALSSTTAQRRD